MRPVNNAALRIPNIFAEKTDRIAFFQIVNSRGEFDVVLDQHGLARCEADDESLVRTTRSVVRENARNDAFALDLNIATTFLECPIDRARRLAWAIAAGQ